MSFVGLDFGEKRIGVAIAESESFVAVPLKVLSSEDKLGLESFLRNLVAERRVEALVVGLPLETKGKRGEMAKKVRSWALSLSKSMKLPVHFVDERFSSKVAERAMAEAGASAKKRKSLADAVSAALILDTFVSRYRELK